MCACPPASILICSNTQKRLFAAAVVAPAPEEPSPPHTHTALSMFSPHSPQNNQNVSITAQRGTCFASAALRSPLRSARLTRLIRLNIYNLIDESSQEDNNVNTVTLRLELQGWMFSLCRLIWAQLHCECVAVKTLHAAAAFLLLFWIFRFFLASEGLNGFKHRCPCSTDGPLYSKTEILHAVLLTFTCVSARRSYSYIFESRYFGESEWCGACAQMPSPFFMWPAVESPHSSAASPHSRAATQAAYLTHMGSVVILPGSADRIWAAGAWKAFHHETLQTTCKQ